MATQHKSFIIHHSSFIILLFAFYLLIGLVATQFMLPATLQVGYRDQRALSGVHELEQIGGRAVRWTTGQGLLSLPSAQVQAPLLLELGLLNARPPGQPDPAVTIAASGAELARFTMPDSLSGEGRHYHLLLPPALAAQARIAINSDTLLLPADPRSLGVAITGATLQPLASGLRLPPPFALLCLAATATLLALALLALAMPRAGALALATLVALGLAWGGATLPLEVLPFLPRLAALTLLACCTIGLVWLLASPVSGQRSAVSGLVIALGLDWWAMPAYQLIMLADGARPAIAPQTLWIGLVVLVGLLVLLALRVFGGVNVAPYAAGLFVAASVAHGSYLVWYAFQRSAPDFWIHFKGARGYIRDGLPLYDIPSIEANHFGFAYKWPPLYAALLAPFVYQAGELVLLGHRILNTLLLAATAVLLVWQTTDDGRWTRALSAAEGMDDGPRPEESRWSEGPGRRRWTETQQRPFVFRLSSFVLPAAAVLMLFNYRPATDTIALGQFDIIALFCCTLVWLLARRGRDAWAGAIIAFMALIKLYPLLLLGFFIVTGRWRAVWGFVLGALVCTGYSVAVLGWQNHLLYLSDVVTRIGGGTAWVENQTFNGFASRLFSPLIAADKFDYLPVTLATYAFFVLTLGLAALAIADWRMLLAMLRDWRTAWRGTDRQSSVLNSQSSALGLFIIVMTMAVPAAWMHYATVLILPFALLIMHAAQRGLAPGSAAMLAVAYALISYGNQWSFFNGEVLGGLSILGYSYKFYGMVLLYSAGLLTLWRVATVRTSAPNPSQSTVAASSPTIRAGGITQP